MIEEVAATAQVFMVIVCDDRGDHYAIFSDVEKASAWADKQQDECIITPYIVDEPDWGSALPS